MEPWTDGVPLMLKLGCGVNRDRAATAQLGLPACLWKCVFFGVFKHFLFGAVWSH